MAARGAEPPRPLRVLLVVDSLAGGGAERYVADLAIELARRRHDVAVACSVGGLLAPELQRARIPVLPLMSGLVKRRVSWRYALALRTLLRERRPDLVHANIYASACAAALATARTGIPLVLTEHTEAPWRSNAAVQMSTWTYGRAARIVAVSTAIERRLRDVHGVPPRSVAHVLNAVRPTTARASPDVAGANRGPIVGYVGRLAPEKAVDVFVRAAAGLVADGEPVRFLVVGEGGSRAELEALACGMGLDGRLRFLGYRRDARAIVERLDVLVQAPRSDGAPLVVLEAMHAGVPVVVSDVGGLPDQVTHGRDGLLVPAGDPRALAGAIRALLSDRPLARQLGQAGRARVALWPHERMVDRVERIYRDALASAERLPRARRHQSL